VLDDVMLYMLRGVKRAPRLEWRVTH
jgi:hypothetical protein